MMDLALTMPKTALAFRGYNITNLGRTPELLATPVYAEMVGRRLAYVSEACQDIFGRPIDLSRRVREGEEPTLGEYGEAVALVYATELAQLDLLNQFHGIDHRKAVLAFGYSLGELVALVASGMLPEDQAIRAPVAMASDCADLAREACMGIVFSRGQALDEFAIKRLCANITAEGAGAIGISAVLSPNSLLVLGQHATLDQFRSEMAATCPSRVYLRKNDSLWPPLHTLIVRQRNVPDRASVMMEQMAVKSERSTPPVVSLVTGDLVESETDIRELLRAWTDHPQRLWDALCAVLASGATQVLHIGPGPNLIPATFHRLSENVSQQTGARSLSGLGKRALRELANRPWLASLLPSEATLLRAPEVTHISLEDWLLDHVPS